MTKEWVEVIWYKKYGVMANWSGKEAKLLQRTFIWFDRAFGKDNAQGQLRIALENYLKEESAFYGKEKHPFSKFAARPETWAVLRDKRPNPAISRPRPTLDLPKMNWSDWEAWCIENPSKAVKGFTMTGKILKKMNPAKYDKLRQFLIDLVGKEQASFWAKEIQVSGIGKELTKIIANGSI